MKKIRTIEKALVFNEPLKKLRVCAYVRVSTNQAEQQESFSAQVQQCDESSKTISPDRVLSELQKVLKQMELKISPERLNGLNQASEIFSRMREL